MFAVVVLVCVLWFFCCWFDLFLIMVLVVFCWHRCCFNSCGWCFWYLIVIVGCDLLPACF